MGIVMPTATESVMSVVPRERGGAGSAITNTSRQVTVALGVAVLGSILAQGLPGTRLAPGLPACQPAVRSAATQSIAATRRAAASSSVTAGAALIALAGPVLRARYARDDRVLDRDRGLPEPC